MSHILGKRGVTCAGRQRYHKYPTWEEVPEEGRDAEGVGKGADEEQLACLRKEAEEWLYMNIYVRLCVCVCVHTHTNKHTNTQTHKHTHTQMHLQMHV